MRGVKRKITKKSLDQPTKPQIHLPQEDSEPEDVENFVEEFGDYLSSSNALFKSLDQKSVPLKKQKREPMPRKPREVEESDSDSSNYSENDWEGKHKPKIVKESTKLPIKDVSGRIHFPKAVQESEESGEEAAEESAGSEEESEELSDVSESASQDSDDADPDKALPKTTSQLKEYLASSAQAILANPEANVAKFRTLLHLTNLLLQKPKQLHLALLTLLNVFIDIIPGYKIREKDTDTKLSKEVKKLWEYEKQLISHYQRYLQLLDKIIKDSDNVQSSLVAITCFNQLLTTHPHFNFTPNILSALVLRANNSNHSISDLACQGLKSLFLVDREKTGGDATVQAVKLIGDLVKKHPKVHPRMIQILESLPLDAAAKVDVSKPGEPKQPQKHLSKRAKKLQKVKKQVESEMQEVQAQYSLDHIRKNQTRVLDLLFLIYFRLLKSEKPSTKLLSATLDGIVKFSDWIDVTVWQDLLGVIRGIAIDESQTSSDHVLLRLKAIVATFEIVLQGTGQAIPVDLKQFVVALYQIMLFSPTDFSDKMSYYTMMIRALDLLLLKQKNPGVEQGASLIKRLILCSLSINDTSSIAGLLACLSLLRSLFVRYTRLTALLDPEGSTTSGIYHAEIPDPDLANPFATLLWEIDVLRRHHHPLVRDYIQYLTKSITQPHVIFPPSLNKSPQDFLEEYDAKEGTRFYQVFPKEPLKKKMRGDQSPWILSLEQHDMQ